MVVVVIVVVVLVEVVLVVDVVVVVVALVVLVVVELVVVRQSARGYHEEGELWNSARKGATTKPVQVLLLALKSESLKFEHFSDQGCVQSPVHQALTPHFVWHAFAESADIL